MNLLYILIYFFSVFVTINIGAQNTISFNYNGAGGLIERKLQVLPQQGAKLIRQTTLADSLYVDSFKVYPNPAKTELRIEGSMPFDSKKGRISFISTSGQLVKSDIYTGDSKTISVADLPNGIYLLEIEFDKKETKNYKIIINN